MQKYFDTVLGGTTGFGAIANASVLVKTLSGSVAIIFSNNGITPKANPVQTDSSGYFEFYAADGRYTLEINAAGFDTVQRQDIILEDPQDASALVASTLTATGQITGTNANFSGEVLVGAPGAASSATTKNYVDGLVTNTQSVVGQFAASALQSQALALQAAQVLDQTFARVAANPAVEYLPIDLGLIADPSITYRIDLGAL